MSLAKWRQETLADEARFVLRVGVVLFGGPMACFSCFVMSTTKVPTSVGAYAFLVFVGLLSGYVFGKVMWRWNKWFERVDRAVSYLESCQEKEEASHNAKASITPAPDRSA